MNNLPQRFVVYCEQREGYLMGNSNFLEKGDLCQQNTLMMTHGPLSKKWP